jgi:hypothetical protein
MSSNSQTFLYLAPRDQSAIQIVSSEDNALFRWKNKDGELVLRIGVDHTPKVPGHLVSLGSDRSWCDIVLPPAFPSRQCHIFINPQTGYLLLRDDTPDHATTLKVPGNQKFSLPRSQPRQKVLFGHGRTASIAMQKTAHFELLRWAEPSQVIKAAARKKALFLQSAAPGSAQRRVLENERIVHEYIRALGSGGYGDVFETLDLGTGDILAVKTFRFTSRQEEIDVKKQGKQEVNVLSNLKHVRSNSCQSRVGLLLLICLSATYCGFCAQPRLGNGRKA